jgi:hypothetical protein
MLTTIARWKMPTMATITNAIATMTTTIKCACGASLLIIANSNAACREILHAQDWTFVAGECGFCPKCSRINRELESLEVKLSERH